MATNIIVKFTEEGAQSLAAEVANITQETVELTTAIDAMKKKLATLDSGSAEFRQLSNEIEAAEIVMKGFTGGIDTFKKELREVTATAQLLIRQMDEMRKKGLEGTSSYKELEKQLKVVKTRAGELKDEIGDLNAETATIGSDTRGVDKLIRATSVMVAGFTVAQGAAALFGDENEDLQKTLLRVNAAMSILVGLQQIQEELTKRDSLFTAAAAKAKALYAAAVGTSTGAMKAFRIAALGILGLGLAAVIAGIAFAYGKLTKAAAEAAKLQREVAEAAQAETTSLNQLLLTARDETANRERRLEAVKQINTTYPEYLANLSLENINTKNINAAIEKQVALILLREKAQILAKKAAEAQIALDERIAKGPNLFQQIFQGVMGIGSFGAEILKGQKEVDKLTASYTAVLSELNKVPPATNSATEATKEATKTQANLNDQLKETVKLSLDAGRIIGEMLGAISGGNLREAADGFTQLKDRVEAFRKAMADANKDTAGGGSRASGNGTIADRLTQMVGKATTALNQYIDIIVSTEQQVTSIFGQALNNRTQREIQALDDRRKAGVISEKEYQRELAQLKEDAYKKQRKADIIDAAVKIPQAALSAFVGTPGGLFAKIIAAAAATAFAAAQVALIARAPIPQFRDGDLVSRRAGLDLRAKGNVTGLLKGPSHEGGGIHINAQGDEYVVQGRAVKKYGVQFMDAVNKMKLEPNIPVPNIHIPHNIHEYGQGRGYSNSQQGMERKMDKMVEELVFISQYVKQGNSNTYHSATELKTISKQITKGRGIRV